LRALVLDLIAAGAAPALRPLTLFPTPCRSYFDACVGARGCKPHLRALGAELFPGRRTVESYGGTFTRFMIAGFAAYRALAMIGVRSYEAYPDLQFRLWSHDPALPPKKAGPRAREARRLIAAALGYRLGISGCDTLGRLDALDAAILSLSALAAAGGGMLVALEHRSEGCFVVALDSDLAAAWSPTGASDGGSKRRHDRLAAPIRLTPQSDDWKLRMHLQDNRGGSGT
jgi:hypothetical protein